MIPDDDREPRGPGVWAYLFVAGFGLASGIITVVALNVLAWLLD